MAETTAEEKYAIIAATKLQPDSRNRGTIHWRAGREQTAPRSGGEQDGPGLGAARLRSIPGAGPLLRHRGGVPKKTITVAQAIAIPGAAPVCVPAAPATGSGLVAWAVIGGPWIES